MKSKASVGGPPVVAGRLFFGFAAVVLFVICQFWWKLHVKWGPGTAGALALAFYAFHVMLVRRRVAATDPIVWIPVAMLLFQFGMAFAIEVLGFEAGGLGYDSWQFGISRSLGRGFWMALLTMTAFLCGIHLAGVRDLSAGPDPTRPRDTSLAAPALVFTIGSLLMTLFGIALVGPSTVFGLYGDWWAAKMAGADERFVDIGAMFTAAGVFGLIASAGPRQRLLRGFAYFVAIVVLAINLAKGDRSSLFSLGIGIGWCYSQSVRRIPWLPTLAAAVVMLMAVPVIAEWRSMRSIAMTREASAVELIAAGAWGMGSSVNAFIYTLDLVPSVKGYAWGYTYWAGIVNAIPNPLPTKGANPLRINTLESAPSAWISSIVAPIWFDEGGGFGYAMGAEWYYNFGMPGVLLGSLLLGFVTGRVRNAAYATALRLVASAVFFGAMSIVVRNAFGSPFKSATWPVVGLATVAFVMRRLVRPARRAPAPRTLLAAAEPPLAGSRPSDLSRL